MTVTIEAADVENAFAKICTKVKVDPVGASFVYPLRTSEKGTHDDITVENGEDLNDSLMTFCGACRGAWPKAKRSQAERSFYMGARSIFHSLAVESMEKIIRLFFSLIMQLRH